MSNIIVPMLLSPYRQCPSCRTVNYDPESKLVRLAEPAPCCGATGEIRITWPSAETHAFLSIARRQRLRSDDGRRIAIIFLSTALELLFENVLWELLAVYRTRAEVSELILDGHRGKDRRTRLFKTLSGKTISGLLKGRQLGGFLADWAELVEARNQIVHGQYFYKRKSDPRDLIKRVSDTALQAFVVLQNHAVGVRPKGNPLQSVVP